MGQRRKSQQIMPKPSRKSMKEETQQPSDKSQLDRAQEEYMAQFQNEKGEHDQGKFHVVVSKLFEVGKAKEKR